MLKKHFFYQIKTIVTGMFRYKDASNIYIKLVNFGIISWVFAPRLSFEKQGQNQV